MPNLAEKSAEVVNRMGSRVAYRIDTAVNKTLSEMYTEKL